MNTVRSAAQRRTFLCTEHAGRWYCFANSRRARSASVGAPKGQRAAVYAAAQPGVRKVPSALRKALQLWPRWMLVWTPAWQSRTGPARGLPPATSSHSKCSKERTRMAKGSASNLEPYGSLAHQIESQEEARSA